MLLKNDVPYDLSRFPKDLEKLKKHFHNRFPVKIVLPPERIVKSRLKNNRLPDKPRSISVDFFDTIKTPQGTEVWRYCERITTDKNGNKHYFPKKFVLRDVARLEANEIEKIFFLFNISRHCKGGLNQGKMVKFMFDDPITDAERLAEQRSQKVKLDNLIYGGAKLGLPIERIRGLAKAMFVAGVDELTDAQTRNLLYQKVSAGKKMDDFMELVDTDKEFDSRVAVQEVIDAGKLVYDFQKRVWSWKVDGEKSQTIFHVAPGKDAYEEIVERYIVDRNFKDDIEALRIAGHKADKKKVKAEVGEEEEE